MDRAQFIDSVARRAATSPAQAESLTHATLRTLAERVTGGESRNLAAQLPREFRDDLCQAAEPAEPFGVAEFIQRIGARAGVDGSGADRGMVAVFKAICKDVTRDEFDNMMAQLPEEFPDVREPVAARAGARQGPHVPSRGATEPEPGQRHLLPPDVIQPEPPQ